jgi:hypothetical protein
MGTEVALALAAKKAFIDFYNGTNADAAGLRDGPARAVVIKSIRHAARIALALHFARLHAGETDSVDVDEATVRSAISLARWLTRETLRVHGQLDLVTETETPRQRLLRSLPDDFKTADAYEAAPSGVTERTVRRWIEDGVNDGLVERIKRGSYRKSSYAGVRNVLNVRRPPLEADIDGEEDEKDIKDTDISHSTRRVHAGDRVQTSDGAGVVKGRRRSGKIEVALDDRPRHDSTSYATDSLTAIT